ncbi:MAG TPA: class I adenylate-forming enzyme family protein [Acidimicrobiales bacterium]|nr:class I adenylate-forming enzyme family protein [Acidimicrobiales bacterium]
MNIGMLLELAAEGMPDRIAVGTAADGISYAQLLERARRGAHVVRANGVERVGLVDMNSSAVPLLLYASALAGVPFAAVNYRLAEDRLRSVIERVAPALVVTDEAARARLQGVRGLELLARSELEARLEQAEHAGDVEVDPDAVAIWLFTSGTTGEPKPALLRHRHLVSYVLSTVEFMCAAEDEATLVSVPPYHVAGMAAILSSTYAGRRIVYLPQFDPDGWVRLAEEEAVTHAMVVPTMLGRLLDAMERHGTTLPSLSHLSYGGGRMPVAVIERAMDLLPHVGLVNAYGLTEASSTVAVLGPDDHRAAYGSDDPAVRVRLESVGRPLPTLELEIRDPLGGVLPPGETGEIHVRGEQIAGEYLGRSVLTPDGWFPTNDSGHLDEAGFLFVEGRLDDVIVRGGENMSPGEIEDVLLQHPAVAEAGVTGVPDDEWGEVAAAAVVFEPGASTTEAELQAWVRERLRSSRTPVVVDVRPALPYNETGKLLRRVLKDELGRLRPRS